VARHDAAGPFSLPEAVRRTTSAALTRAPLPDRAGTTLPEAQAPTLPPRPKRRTSSEAHPS